MQGIVFVYDPVFSAKNRLFTVRLEKRKWNGKVWVSHGERSVFTVASLKRFGSLMVDRNLFSQAFRSESEYRSAEGRFFSGDEEFTRLRISPSEVAGFITRALKSKSLCDEAGSPFGFRVLRDVVPLVTMAEEKGDFQVTVTLSGKRMSRADYLMSGPVLAAVFGKTVILLKRGFPANILKRFYCGKKISRGEYEKELEILGGFSGLLTIALPEKEEIRVICPENVHPVLSFEPTLRFASLGFDYPEGVYFGESDTRDMVFVRERHLEVQRNHSLESDFRKVLEGAGAAYRKSSRGDWFFSAKGLEAVLGNLEKKGFRLLVEGKPLKTGISVSWRLSVADDLICLDGSVSWGKRKTGIDGLIDGFLCGHPWIEFPDGSLAFMGKEVREIMKRLEYRGDFKDEEVLFERFDFAFVEEVMSRAGDLSFDKDFMALMEFSKGPEKTGAAVIPKPLEKILRPYQKQGVSWLFSLWRNGFCGILADDMGLGKTLQVLSFLQGLRDSGEKGTTLLIVPKTLIWNWESEILKFTPELSYTLHTGSRRTSEGETFSGFDLVITSYSLALRDERLFQGFPWKSLILDEAQAIKNPDAQTTLAIKKIRAGFRLSLTGTPVENRPLDLWSQFDFLMPGFLGTRGDFGELYDNGERFDALKKLVSPFLLRRMKSQVCRELPPKTEIVLHCDFEESQKELYDRVLGVERDRFHNGGDTNAVNLLTALLRLRQIACHPDLAGMDDTGAMASGKLSRVVDMAAEILSGGYKILVFSQFTGHLKKVRESFAREGVVSFYLDGATADRKKVIEEFKACTSPCVFLISLKAGGVGLNLTEAGYVFLLDPWWNPAAENQAVDRSHRIGQDYPVTVYRFITRGSIEEKVLVLQEKKKKMVGSVVGDGCEGSPFTEEELAGLLV